MNLGQTLRAAREARRLGLRHTARLVGISSTFLSRVETNAEDAVPSEEVLARLAEVLDVEADELCRLAGRIPVDVKVKLLSDSRWFEAVRNGSIYEEAKRG